MARRLSRSFLEKLARQPPAVQRELVRRLGAGERLPRRRGTGKLPARISVPTDPQKLTAILQQRLGAKLFAAFVRACGRRRP